MNRSNRDPVMDFKTVMTVLAPGTHFVPAGTKGTRRVEKKTGNGTGNGISFPPEGSNEMILPEDLPMPCRNVLETWNGLPLKKFTGLVPSLLRKMNILLDRYGEEAVCQTVEGIRFSSFLLGKTSGFHVTLGWLLDPDHFANVLSGKYLDRDDGENSCWV